MRAKGIYRSCGRRHLDADADAGMLALERCHDVRQEICTGDARRDEREWGGGRLAEGSHAPDGLHEERLGPEHVIGEEFTGRGQRATPGLALDELHAGLPFDIGDVLGDGGLTDPNLLRGGRERAAPCERRERSQACFQIHN